MESVIKALIPNEDDAVQNPTEVPNSSGVLRNEMMHSREDLAWRRKYLGAS